MADSPVILVVQETNHVTPIVVSPVLPAVTPVLVTEGGRIGPPGLKGDPGIKGDKGDSGGTLITKITASPISGHRVVLLNSNGTADYASSNNISHATRVVGISTHAADAASPLIIAIHDEIVEPTWNWDTSKPVYLSGGGYLSQVEPVFPTDKFSLIVGMPLSPTSLFINIGIPITLV